MRKERNYGSTVMSLTHCSEMNDDGGKMVRHGVDDFFSSSLLG